MAGAAVGRPLVELLDVTLPETLVGQHLRRLCERVRSGALAAPVAELPSP